jgi:opacity protein-like surface antigen
MLTPVWLVGIEGDLSYGHRSSSISSAYNVINDRQDGFTFRGTSTLTLMWQATIRGRLGVVSGPWHFFGTGGVAFTRAKWHESDVATVIYSGDPVGTDSAAYSVAKTLTGGVVGGGFEYMFSPNWIGRVEYLYEFFDSFNVPQGFGPQVGNVDIGDVQKVLIGIAYKFGP